MKSDNKMRFVYFFDTLLRLKYAYLDLHLNTIQSIYNWIKLKIIQYSVGISIILISILTKYDSSDLINLDKIINDKLSKHDLYLKPSRSFYFPTAKIIPTYQCNFNCKYCYQSNNSKLNKIEFIDLSFVENFLDFLNNISIKQISIIGGEVFLYFDKLIELIQLSQKKKINVFGITTNGFWCQKRRILRKYLRRLKQINFKGNINISLGEEHIRQLNLENFDNLWRDSISILGHNIFRFTIESKNLNEFYHLKKKVELHLKSAKKNFNIRFHGLTSTKNCFNSTNPFSWTHCCALGPLLNPDGSLSFCLGPGNDKKEFEFKLNNLESKLSNKVYFSNYKLFKIISENSFEKLRQLIKTKNLSDLNFNYPCDLCFHISSDKIILENLYGELYGSS
jgi:organic radical activating enzyme